MKKSKKVSFLVLTLALLVAVPALVVGQTAPPATGGNGGKDVPTPVPTDVPTAVPTPVPTETPVVGDGDCNGGHKHKHHHYRFRQLRDDRDDND